MKFNRYKSSTKKGIDKKYFLPIVLITIVVALCSYTTLAWIVSSTTAIDNKFKLQTAGVSIVEEFDGEAKEDVCVTNTAEATMYVRVALIEQIERSETNIETSQTESFIVPKLPGESYFTYEDLTGANWLLDGEYYYYTKPLKAGETTSMLFTKATQSSDLTLDDGEELSLTVMTDAIQVNAISEWNIGVDADGNITGGRG